MLLLSYNIILDRKMLNILSKEDFIFIEEKVWGVKLWQFTFGLGCFVLLEKLKYQEEFISCRFWRSLRLWYVWCARRHMVRLYTGGDALCKSYLQQRMRMISRYKHSRGRVHKTFCVLCYIAFPLKNIPSQKSEITVAWILIWINIMPIVVWFNK